MEKEKEKEDLLRLKEEAPEVGYKRQLVEKFSFRDTELIKRIYSENRVYMYSISIY